ncbi:hypothetical protein [Fischerella sp. JS2]|uniref:hypothetical protein n=1 Tax=Fischerella sp. JS2 TaxID=2597771 RepID=UPI0028EB7617|nr:hypothetical protein [Fischerella sp. JS2]
MNEADTPNNGAFIEPLHPANASQPQQASCPFYSVLPVENRTISQLPLLAPAEDKQCQEDASCQESMTETNKPVEVISNSQCVLELNQQQLEELKPELDWVAEPEKEKEALIDSEFKQLLALNEELHSANNNLYEQVEGLKTALSESEAALQWQKKRSAVAEAMLNQQTQELSAAQEQIQSLFQQLETALQTVQNQETAIENYKAQLEINQQRLALLERECTLIQTKYNEQSHQLLQSENSCRELRTRLMRQQRQTLQFKAALEKCLETPPIPSSDSTDTHAYVNDVDNRQVRNYGRTHSLVPNQQPIQPWSAELDASGEDTGSFWVESSSSTPPTWDNLTSAKLSTADTPSLESISTSEQSTTKPEIDDATEPETVSSSDSFSLDEQVENLIQLFFAAQTTSASPASVAKNTEDMEDAKSDNEVVTPIWETVATPVEDTKEPIIVISPSADTDSEENEDFWLDVSPLPLSLSESTESSKSPSPLLYPERPPKGRKSLASVELPNFRPNT